MNHTTSTGTTTKSTIGSVVNSTHIGTGAAGASGNHTVTSVTTSVNKTVTHGSSDAKSGSSVSGNVSH